MKKYLLVIFVLSVFYSCKKNNTGGSATVAAIPQHHGSSIKGAVLYVKFGAEELPSNPTANYDLRIEGDPKEDHVHVEGLRYGHYYLYAEGYDSTIMQTVRGGLSVKIKWSERKEELDVKIPVTE